MIRLNQLGLQRGGRTLFENVDLMLHAGQRAGLVGANGAGKSSLLKLLLGELHPDHGDLVLPPSLRVAHMAQEVEAVDRTALDYVMDGHLRLRELQQAIVEAEQGEDNDSLAKHLSEMDEIDGYRVESKAAQLLHGLGFGSDKIHKPVAEFSGGWRMRLNLARALLMPSDILLLDEPTNHLDLDALLWLQQWLVQYSGMLLLISHDREFLDAVVTHIAHMHQQSVKVYTGNYSAFERARAEALAQQQITYAKQQQRASDLQRFVDRFRAKASKAKQAQSRLKALDRMQMSAPAHAEAGFSFTFQAHEQTSDPLLTLESADFGFAKDRVLLKNLNLSIHPEQRVGLLGANGVGKSTLIKTLANEVSLVAGKFIKGEHLRVGYFAQHQLEAIDEDASPLLHIERISPQVSQQEARKFLGSFGFHGDTAVESCTNFSGGERARLALALIAWQRPNLLLLDEPTNHLDLEVRHALTVALQAFSGAVLLVSHDRNLIKNTVDELWILQNGCLSVFDGSLEDYQHAIATSSSKGNTSDTAEALSKDRTLSNTAEDRKARKREAAEKRQQLRPLKQKIQKLETVIDALQTEMTELHEQLQAPELYQESAADKLQILLQRQHEVQASLEENEELWLGLQSELELVESEL